MKINNLTLFSRAASLSLNWLQGYRRAAMIEEIVTLNRQVNGKLSRMEAMPRDEGNMKPMHFDDRHNIWHGIR